MSKRIKEMLVACMRASFLGTLDDGCCAKALLLSISHCREDGSPWNKENGSYVLIESNTLSRICHISLDANGKGSLNIHDLPPDTYRIQLCDAQGDVQFSHVSCMVDGQCCPHAFAQVELTAAHDEEVTLCCTHVCTCTLQVCYLLLDEEDVMQPIDTDHVELRLRHESGHVQTLCLKRSQHFCGEVQIEPGRYEVEGACLPGCQRSWRFDDQDEDREGVFFLKPGQHALQVIDRCYPRTALTLEGAVRMHGELCLPPRNSSFCVRVVSMEADEVFYLTQENNFCLLIEGLPCGCYDICVQEGWRDHDITYWMEGQEEVDQLQVVLGEDEHPHVQIIATRMEELAVPLPDSPLRICKYVRDTQGRLCKPQRDAVYKVSVCGCGMQETFVLNAGNNFCVELADLCSGMYEVRELGSRDYITTYQVNGEMERTSACIQIEEGVAGVVRIINEIRNKGRVRISKYIQNACGELVKPQPEERFTGWLSSYCYRQPFTLCAENNWCVYFDDLHFGSYEVREACCPPYTCCYQVNGCMHSYARFIVDDGRENDVRIINRMRDLSSGMLCIRKMEETASSELVKPPYDACFTIEVCTDNGKETYTLQQENDWTLQLCELPLGLVSVRECPLPEYQTHYLVDGICQQDACIGMDRRDHQIVIVNRRKRSGCLSVDVKIEDTDGVHLPQPQENFEVLVEGIHHTWSICLNHENNWCQCLCELPHGAYRIMQKDTYGYRVIYETDGQRSSFARIRLDEHDEAVTIINQTRITQGSLTLHKRIIEKDGQEHRPQDEECYEVHVWGEGLDTCVSLHQGNDWSICWKQLQKGRYHVEEKGALGYRVQGVWQQDGCIDINGGDMEVEILNAAKEENIICIKACLLENGQLLALPQDMCFSLLLKGRDVQQSISLHAGNDFCACLRDLPPQAYVLCALDHTPLHYEIDTQIQADGCFRYEGGHLDITVAQELCFPASMEICAWEEIDGCLQEPAGDICYELTLESERGQRCIELNRDNAYCVQLHDLQPGHYALWEQDGEAEISYRVNQVPMEKAIIDIRRQDVCVDMIHHRSRYGSGRICLEGIVEIDGVRSTCLKEALRLHMHNQEQQWELVLDEENEGKLCLEDLPQGTYWITESGADDVCFIVGDQEYADAICVELGSDLVCIQVIRRRKTQFDLTIQKCWLDADGQDYTPQEQAPCSMVLLHKGGRHTFLLDAANHWTKTLPAQEAGSYELREQGQTPLWYQINDGDRQQDGSFHLLQDTCVKVWNRQERLYRVCLQSDTIPQGSSVSVQVYSDMRQQCWQLTAANNYRYCGAVSGKRLRLEATTCDGAWQIRYEIAGKRYEQIDMELQEDVEITLVLTPRQAGTLEICKQLKHEDGSCHIPDDTQRYTLLLRHEQNVRRIVLDAANHFYSCVHDLPAGMYQLEEENGNTDTVYVVDGAATTGAVSLQIQGDVHTVSVINPVSASGSIMLAKYIRSGDLLQRPQEPASYVFHITGEQDHQLLTLDASNQWMAELKQLKPGRYTIKETATTDIVSFLINDAMESTEGVVEVNGNRNVVQIINTPRGQGSITLQKYVRNTTDLQTPPPDMTVTVRISRPGFNEQVVLTQSNHWTQTLHGLQPGIYVIDELDADNVSYIVNGGNETAYGVVQVQQDEHMVMLINQQVSTGGSIRLDKYVRDTASGELQLPPEDMTVQIRLSRPGYQRLLTLSAENRWSMIVDELASGMYVLSEEGDSKEVGFIVDGASETMQGVVTVNDDRHIVQVINTEAAAVTGILRIRKRIRQGDGSLQVPADEESFIVSVSGDDGTQQIELQKENDWQQDLGNLRNGTYHIQEISAHDYQVSYQVDGQIEAAQASVAINGSTHDVVIINARTQPSGVLEISKFIRQANGALMRPVDGDVYEIQLKGISSQRTLILNNGNGFTAVLRDLPADVYTVEEIGNEDFVTTYRLNGGTESAQITIDMRTSTSQQLDILNERRENRSTMEIFKYMLEENGNFIAPQADEVFFFTLSGQGVHDRYELNKNNSWHITLTQYPEGEYQIQEVQTPYRVRYFVDSANLSDTASFRAEAGKTNIIGIINYRQDVQNGSIRLQKRICNAQDELVDPAVSDSFLFELKSENGEFTQMITLDHENGFVAEISNLPYGSYTLWEYHHDDVLWDVDGQTGSGAAFIQIQDDTPRQVLAINTVVAVVQAEKDIHIVF